MSDKDRVEAVECRPRVGDRRFMAGEVAGVEEGRRNFRRAAHFQVGGIGFERRGAAPDEEDAGAGGGIAAGDRMGNGRSGTNDE